MARIEPRRDHCGGSQYVPLLSVLPAVSLWVGLPYYLPLFLGQRQLAPTEVIVEGGYMQYKEVNCMVSDT